MNQDRRTRRRLVRLLQVAYSSEMAAALAYQGHAHSVEDRFERDSLLEIEQDEWRHREEVGRLLEALGERPLRGRELLFGTVGRVLRALCPWSGWYLPMIVAGAIEMLNVRQYVSMAGWSRELGYEAESELLEEMAEVERRHQAFFFGSLRRRLGLSDAAVTGRPAR
jgi:rubrerythrin